MAELRLVSLDEVFTDAQLERLRADLAEVGVEKLPDGEDDTELEEVVAEDPLTDFVDRLEASDLACDIYLPIEFEGLLEAGDVTVGSVYALLEVLEDLREELDIDSDDGDEDEDELDMDVIEEQLRFVWRIFMRAASTSIDRQMPFQVVS